MFLSSPESHYIVHGKDFFVVYVCAFLLVFSLDFLVNLIWLCWIWLSYILSSSSFFYAIVLLFNVHHSHLFNGDVTTMGRLICNQNKTKQTTYLCRSLQHKSIFKPLFAGENDNLPVAPVVISHVSFYIRPENLTEKKRSKTSIKRAKKKQPECWHVAKKQRHWRSTLSSLLLLLL